MRGNLQVQFAKMPLAVVWWFPILCVFATPTLSSSITNNPFASFGDSFKQCLVSQHQPTTLTHCLGTSTISKLQSLDSDPQFDIIDGLTLSKDQKDFREAYNFGNQDPADFRTIIDSLGHVFGRRSMLWDMGFLYPGLAMRVAPSSSPGGILEFILDPHRELLNKHALKEIGTGRLLARQFVLPFLLGFKFNVATIIPILFGILALMAKKAVIISKIALIISSAFGLGTLLLGSGGGNKVQYGAQAQQHSPGFNPAFGGHYNRFPEDEYPETVYRGVAENPAAMSDQYSATNNNNIEQFRSMKGSNSDPLRLYGSINLQENYEQQGKSKGRNFAWENDEKKKAV